jgi:hypothetical protein
MNTPHPLQTRSISSRLIGVIVGAIAGGFIPLVVGIACMLVPGLIGTVIGFIVFALGIPSGVIVGALFGAFAPQRLVSS